MSKTAGDYNYGAMARHDGGRQPELVCGADELKGMLADLAQQFAESDRRHLDTLRDMQSRLETLGRGAEHVREQVPQHYASAFARIEDGVQSLADRVAKVSHEREIAKAAASLMHVPGASEGAAAAQPTAMMTGADVAVHVHAQAARPADKHDEPLVSPMAPTPSQAAAVKPASTVVHSVPGAPDEPWDQASANALAELYDSGIADMRPAAPHDASLVAAAPMAAPVVAVLPLVQAPPLEAAVPMDAMPAPAGTYTDQAWIAARFAEIARQIEQSAAVMRPDSSLAMLDERLGQLESRLGTALENVATRADVDGLRIVEAHMNELVMQFERTEQQLNRIDQVEQQLAAVAHHLSDERLTALFAQAMPPAAGPSEDDIEVVAMAVADRVASRLPAPMAAAANGVDQGSIADLKRIVESFAAGQRETEDHTSTMLDTMQQAMIRMLDRMDAIEAAGSSYPAAPANFAPVSSAPPQAAPSPAPHAASAQAAMSARPDQAAFAEAMAEVRANQAQMQPMMQPEPHVQLPAEPPAGRKGAAPAREDFRAAAVADARRAARKVAAQAADGPSLDADPVKMRRGAPAVQMSTPEPVHEEKVRSRTPLMVAGIALVAGVGLLAASVTLSRGGFFGGAQQTAEERSKLTIDNGGAEAGQAEEAVTGNGQKSIVPPSEFMPDGGTPRAAPAGAPKPGASVDPRTRLRVDTEAGAESAGTVVLPANAGEATRTAALQPGLGSNGLGIAVTPASTNSIPDHSDLARARQQRNLASLASQLAAVQANAPAVPASLIPDVGASLQQSEPLPPSELPPAFIGPISLRTAAQKGDPSAEFEVAARFAEGRGIAQDFKQAMTWYQRSAQRGFAPAQYRLGTLFERGIGTKADIARAKIWYGRAAEQGHVKAMHNLAVLNAGRDPSADYAAALQWFTAAAERGLADSQYNLGVLFESGLGLQRDYKQAYHWLSLAALGGDKDAGRRRDAIRGKLDEADLATVEAGVNAWRAKPTDSAINDARVAGEAWKSRQSVGR